MLAAAAARFGGVAAAAALPATAAAFAPACHTALTKLAPSLTQLERFSASRFAPKAAEPAPEEPFVPQMHPGMARDDACDRSTAAANTPAGGKFTDSYMLMHPVYSKDYVESVRPSHRPPVKMHEKVGYYSVQACRTLFDVFTGYSTEMSERKWLARFLYLETVAGVPGMVAGMLRHMRSLRSMERDNGWIHTLLEEAENERMHLLTFMKLRQPGIMFRAAVLAGQAVIFTGYTLAYSISPKACHSFVGYLEEEAVKTYSRCLEDLDAGKLPQWTNLASPDIGKNYWKLGPDATMRDLLLAIRADEACHMYVNHVFAHLNRHDPNPFQPGSVHVP
jgi:threonyl-tRNA synthetase